MVALSLFNGQTNEIWPNCLSGKISGKFKKVAKLNLVTKFMAEFLAQFFVAKFWQNS